MKRIFLIASILIIPVLVFAQDAPKKKAYYFYGEQCPHCKAVDEYFQANGIYDKYDITKLEVVSNPFNGKMFLEFGKAFGVKDWGGVPTIVFGDKYLTGDSPIKDNFVSEIDAADNANELSDQNKIAAANASNNSGENQNSPNIPAAAAEGNKKNYFPVVIIALIALGAGALIYVNRKKT
jgi:glutaredoxin-related protein